MNPEIAKLYKWSVLRDGYGRWVAKPLVPTGGALDTWFIDRVVALNFANQKVSENAGQRVMMALMLAAVQGVNTLG